MKFLPLLLALACGGGPQLSNLRCRDPAHCQDVEDPLKVLLAVDFLDDTATLDKGVLNLRVNGGTQQTVSLSDMFAAQGIAITNFDNEMMALYRPTREGGYRDIAPRAGIGAASRSSLGFGCALLDIVLDGYLDLVAVNGQGHSSNEPSLTFTLHLGGP